MARGIAASRVASDENYYAEYSATPSEDEGEEVTENQTDLLEEVGVVNDIQAAGKLKEVDPFQQEHDRNFSALPDTEQRLIKGFDHMTVGERVHALSEYYQEQDLVPAALKNILAQTKYDSFAVVDKDGEHSFRFGQQVNLPIKGAEHCIIVGLPETKKGAASRSGESNKVALLNQTTNELFDLSASQLARAIDSVSKKQDALAA